MFEVRRAEPSTLLSERGKRSDGLYVLLSGNVTARGDEGEETRIARGSAFGHASLVGAVGADVTVKAATGTEPHAAAHAALAQAFLDVKEELARARLEDLGNRT